MDREFVPNWIKRFSPDLVAITAMTNEIGQASIIDRYCKKNDIPTVLGGCHITAEPYGTLIAYPEFTNIIEGEGEWKFTEYIGEDSKIFKCMDDFPDPAFDLIDWKKYRLSPFGCKKEKSIGLVTSRGCFGKCTFCSRKVFGNKFRGYSVHRLIEMLDRIKKDHGIDDFLFYDDLFVGNRRRLIEFCEAIIGRRFTWSCCSRVDVLDLPTLNLMKRAGCWMIEYGIESGSQRILDSMKKGITLDTIRSTISLTRKSGIMSKGNFILGNLYETKKSLEETINFASSLPLDMMQHTFLAPLPGTECYEKAKNEGEFNSSWEATNTFAINFIPKELTNKYLKSASCWLTVKFYMNPCRWVQLKKHLTWRQIWSGIKTLLKFF
jgi:radical SAM superfamily enzyme YgiQ (UPF0313 family)